MDFEGVYSEGASSEVTVKEDVVTDMELEVDTSVVLVSEMADSEAGAFECAASEVMVIEIMNSGDCRGSLWSITAKNTDCSTGPLARPFARWLAPLTHSLAPDCLLRSHPPLCSLVRSLAHFAHFLARGTVIVNDWMAIYFGP